MRAVVQRVSRAAVYVEDQLISAIGPGLLVLLGVGREDTEADARYLAEKIAGLRIFADEEGKMNRSLLDTGGEVLLVSQFTLYGDCRKGKRPNFTEAAPPDQAEILYESCRRFLTEKGLAVKCGCFGAMMQVELVNDGPVTILPDSQKNF